MEQATINTIELDVEKIVDAAVTASPIPVLFKPIIVTLVHAVLPSLVDEANKAISKALGRPAPSPAAS